MKKDNKGFSLIELILVITIMAIVVGGAFITMQSLNYANVSRTAKTVNASLAKVRIENMSKGDKQYLHIYVIDNNVYMDTCKVDSVTITEDEGKLIGKGMNVFYKMDNGTEGELVDAGSGSISVSFDRSSGALSVDYSSLEFKKAGRKVTIKLVKETGKHWYE